MNSVNPPAIVPRVAIGSSSSSSICLSMKQRKPAVVRAQICHRRSAKHTLTPILRRHRTRYSNPEPLPQRFMIPSLGVDVVGNDNAIVGDASVGGIAADLEHGIKVQCTSTTPRRKVNGGSPSTFSDVGFYADKDRLAFLPMPPSPRSPSPDSVITNINSHDVSTVPNRPPTVSPIAPSTEPATTTHIRFNNLVRVKRIPSRSHYPDSVKKHLWCNSKEIQANARRNAIEYASESWDWRSAVEEDGMFWNQETQRHVHPVHVHSLRRQQRHMWQERLRAQARQATASRKQQLAELVARERQQHEHLHHIVHPIHFSPVHAMRRT